MARTLTLHYRGLGEEDFARPTWSRGGLLRGSRDASQGCFWSRFAVGSGDGGNNADGHGGGGHHGGGRGGGCCGGGSGCI
ncbi:hypothetical protein SLEP1_g41278 [Rubroshorea leprosula]|uniref:Uncharacterized protein n=1 Tax=Rubroshorea leprosula TaxID=152421 RepID=A0AAV5L666_9ROSI|nr:hypothetical protein SLEP1_g41278 [Rubroshorea leprosula]